MEEWIINAIKIILSLGFLIFIHELGHFIVAKKCGIRVQEFALGFGPKLFKKKKGETEYTLRLLPLGGFVQMEGESESSNDERAFINKSIPKRLAVVVAGSLMNIIFAILILMLLSFSKGVYSTNEVKEVPKGYVSEQNDIRPGDVIISANDKKVNNLFELQNIFAENKNQTLVLQIKRGEEYITKTLNPLMKLNLNISEDKKIMDNVENQQNLDFIKQLGFRIGDEIVSIKGVAVNNLSEIEEIIKNSNEKTAEFVILREGKEIKTDILIEYIKTFYIGITTTQKSDFGGLLYSSVQSTGYIIELMFVSLKDLVTGNVGIKELSGPVGIASEISKTNDFTDLLFLVGIISLNLGIVNLLPILPLDGGKVVVLLVEAVRRKKVSPEKEAAVGLVGFAAFILLAICVTYFDIKRFM